MAFNVPAADSKSEALDDNPAFILLHPRDNVMICCRRSAAGDVTYIDDSEIVLSEDIEVGHKIARTDLAVGDKVMRYNAPIGSMTRTAAMGSHIHTHNLKSDYIASHGRDAVHAKDSQ